MLRVDYTDITYKIILQWFYDILDYTDITKIYVISHKNNKYVISINVLNIWQESRICAKYVITEFINWLVFYQSLSTDFSKTKTFDNKNVLSFKKFNHLSLGSSHIS